MGAARKLQSEIDRCLKKVQEGIDEFDQIWQKVHDTENANQKEKLEADLKKEIKKLQRLRDQIKSWISGADIKDKSALLEARKAIEREMERFKTCEKEAKMKQFSKAALGQADKLDPKEQAKMESREWINDMVDKLNVRIEQFEYEMEELQAGLKKKAKPPPKLVQLEEVVLVHKKHTSALEKALRCLDNDAITSEEIDPLKDDLDYYIAMDLDEHYDNTEDMYCDIADRLEAVEAAAPAASIASIGTHLIKGKDGKAKGSGGGSKDDEEREKEKERERERAAAAAVKAQLIAQGNSNVKPLEDDERPKSGPHGASRPPLTTQNSGGIPPPSPLGGSSTAPLPPPPLVPPSPKLQPTPRSSIDVPPSPSGQLPGRAGPTAAAAAAAAAGSPADQKTAAAAAQNGPTAAAASPAAAQPPPPAGPTPAAAPAGRPAGVTLAALVGAGVREQLQKLESQQQQQQQAAATAAQQQQQQQDASTASQPQQAVAAPAAPAAGSPAAPPPPAGVPTPATPAGGRLGAWMAGVPESAKAAAAAAGPAPGQQQQQAPTAAAVLAKGLPAAGAKGAAAGAASQQQQQQQQQQAAAATPTAADQQTPAEAPAAAATSSTTNGPVPASASSPAGAAATCGAAVPAAGAAGEVAASTAAASGGPAQLEGAAGAVVLEGWSRMAAQELGLGTAMHTQVPRSITALPVLEACMRAALPQASDSDWNRPKPRHPIVGPASYPKTQPDVISAPGLFRKMDPEALFFAFYYQPDTYQQYLAAQELKRQSWRYHKHHNAWFQRYAEPSVTSEEYEQGTYVYFDYNIMHEDLQTGWCYRRKENFTFRYDALEDELPVSSV